MTALNIRKYEGAMLYSALSSVSDVFVNHFKQSSVLSKSVNSVEGVESVNKPIVPYLQVGLSSVGMGSIATLDTNSFHTLLHVSLFCQNVELLDLCDREVSKILLHAIRDVSAGRDNDFYKQAKIVFLGNFKVQNIFSRRDNSASQYKLDVEFLL